MLIFFLTAVFCICELPDLFYDENGKLIELPTKGEINKSREFKLDGFSRGDNVELIIRSCDDALNPDSSAPAAITSRVISRKHGTETGITHFRCKSERLHGKFEVEKNARDAGYIVTFKLDGLLVKQEIRGKAVGSVMHKKAAVWDGEQFLFSLQTLDENGKYQIHNLIFRKKNTAGMSTEEAKESSANGDDEVEK